MDSNASNYSDPMRETPLFDNVPHPVGGWSAIPTPETPAKKERKPRKAKAPTPEPTFESRLLDALDFVSIVQRTKGTDQQMFCFMGQRSVIAFDGVVACGAPIEFDIFAAPHTRQMAAALAECRAGLVLTQIAPDRLMLRTGEFAAVVPCVSPTTLTAAFPDPPVARVDDRLRDAFAAVAGLVSDKAEHVATAAVQLRPGTVVGTDGNVILEAFHGIDLPPGLLLPKAFLAALKKTKRILSQFGFSRSTATFYFADGSWMRTQLYVESYPNLDAILNHAHVQRPIPEGFFEAVAVAGEFSPDGFVHCGDGRISSHASDDPTALGSARAFNFPSAVDKRVYSAKGVQTMARYAQWMDDQSRPDTTLFGGPTVRGALTHRTVKQPTIGQAVAQNAIRQPCADGHTTFVDGCAACFDNLIPF